MSVSKLRFHLALMTTLLACGVGQTTFLHPDYTFSYIEKAAVIPFENLTEDRGAGERASRYFVSGLLATESFDVIEPGEVGRVLEGFGLVRTAELTQERAVEIGKQLGVQALFLGTVAESSSYRSGSSTRNVVTIDVRMIETDTGITVWSTTNTEKSGGFWSSLFGTGGGSLGEVTRKCVQRTIDSLIN